MNWVVSGVGLAIVLKGSHSDDWRVTDCLDVSVNNNNTEVLPHGVPATLDVFQPPAASYVAGEPLVPQILFLLRDQHGLPVTTGGLTVDLEVEDAATRGTNVVPVDDRGLVQTADFTVLQTGQFTLRAQLDSNDNIVATTVLTMVSGPPVNFTFSVISNGTGGLPLTPSPVISAIDKGT